MDITNSSQVRLPFSLECYCCDAGMDLATVEAAIVAGWTEIREDSGLAWNYLGLCPECAASENRPEPAQ